MPVFPWSMSDFKPGDRYFERATREQIVNFILYLCSCYAQTFFEPTPGFNLQK